MINLEKNSIKFLLTAALLLPSVGAYAVDTNPTGAGMNQSENAENTMPKGESNNTGANPLNDKIEDIGVLKKDELTNNEPNRLENKIENATMQKRDLNMKQTENLRNTNVNTAKPQNKLKNAGNSTKSENKKVKIQNKQNQNRQMYQQKTTKEKV